MADTPKPVAVIDWYRIPISPKLFKELHQRSDWRAFMQTGGFLAVVAATATLAFWSWGHWPWWATVLCLFLHGTVTVFNINAMHELGHGTVFRTKWLNAFFVRVVSFLVWLHPEMFTGSHQRHHRYTLHPPDDQEIVLPVTIGLKNFFIEGLVNPRGWWWTLKYTVRIARNKIGSDGGWEAVCFPADQPQLRRVPVLWARAMLAGHLLIAAVSIYHGLWIIPVIVSFAPFSGWWLFLLLNNTQHIGRVDYVPDFRLCCRTVVPNPIVRFLFWHMNYHTEHHMYAAVPCYNLGRLHRAVKHEMPACHGIIGAWLEIAAVMKEQKKDPSYRPKIDLPEARGVARAAA
jgi:fatty acid desaturase